MITQIEKVVLTGKTHTTVGGSGGRLNLELSRPGNEAKPDHSFLALAPHPLAEQLFAGAWSACFTTAIGIAAKDRKLSLPADLSVDIEVDLGHTGPDYFLQARISVNLPGVDRADAADIIHAADQMCVFSKATRGNIAVSIDLA